MPIIQSPATPTTGACIGMNMNVWMWGPDGGPGANDQQGEHTPTSPDDRRSVSRCA
jgi:hypothetical protein